MNLLRRADQRFDFVSKLASAAVLVWLADRLIYPGSFIGPGIDLFALAWTILTIASNAALRRDPRARVAAGLALVASAVLIDDPSLLAWVLFSATLTMAALLPRAARFDDAWAWSQRLLLTCITAIAGPWRDAGRLLRTRRRVERKPLARFVPLLALPLAGGTIFVTVFAQSNPLIANALAALRLPPLNFATVVRLGWWGVVLTLVWSTLRPRRVRPLVGTFAASPGRAIPGV